MELDARKIKILEAIIDDYILTASPVGSRTISRREDIGYSPATIRNEMADLEDMGYLEQPHTSAGRIPSDKAYRYYVNSIMHEAKLTDKQKVYISQHYTHKLDEVDEVIRQTAWVLSKITKYTSMVLSPQLQAVKLKYIHIVPIGDGKALVVVVTDAGITRDSIIHIPCGITGEQLVRMSGIMTERFANKRLDEIGMEDLFSISDELREHKAFIDAMLQSVSRSVDEGGKNVELSGATNMLNYPEYNDVEKARALLSVIEGKDLLYKMLSEATKMEFSITIGGENTDPGIKDCSVITATYKVGDSALGSFGVIGPTRMDYPKVMAVMSYIGKSLSDVLTNMFEEERK